jgi:hypothetical protein
VFGENLVKGTGFGSEITNDNASAVIRPWWCTRLTTSAANPTGGGDSGLSVLDFSLFSTFRDNVRNGNFNGIDGVLGFDWLYGDATQLVTFFQNHDVGPDNDFKFRFGGETWKAAIAYNLLWTIRGIPCLYQGEEVEFMKGAPQDIDGPSMTLDQTGRAYFGDRLLPGAIAGTKAHPLYRHIQRLNQIRRAIPALQKAPLRQVQGSGNGLSFVRDYQNGQSYAVVGLASANAQTLHPHRPTQWHLPRRRHRPHRRRLERHPDLRRRRPVRRHLRPRRPRQARHRRRVPALSKHRRATYARAAQRAWSSLADPPREASHRRPCRALGHSQRSITECAYALAFLARPGEHVCTPTRADQD